MASGGIVLLPALRAARNSLRRCPSRRDVSRQPHNMGSIASMPPLLYQYQSAMCRTCRFHSCIWGSPAYWNGYVYWGSANWSGVEDNLQAFSLNANGSGHALDHGDFKDLADLCSPRSDSSFPPMARPPASCGPWITAASRIPARQYQLSDSVRVRRNRLGDLVVLKLPSFERPRRSGRGGQVCGPIIANGKVYFGSSLRCPAMASSRRQ